MANFLESILGSTTNVYIAVSQSNQVEMAVIDKQSGEIKNYARTSIEYNEATREIANYDILKNKIKKLYEECDVQPQNSNVYFSVPTVWFGYKDNIPIELEDDGIQNVVLGELEQSYIFKNNEPVPYFFDAPASNDMNTKAVFYTAIQSNALDSIIGMFKDLGATLTEVDVSLFCDLRALITCGLTETEMDADTTKWRIMTINNSGFQLFNLEGKHITEYYEEPLPVKSYEGDEIYSAIENAAQVALVGVPAETLVIISETDLVSADILSNKLQFEGRIVAIDDNKYRKAPLSTITQMLIPEQQDEVSLHLIGLLSDRSIYPVNLNFLSSITGYVGEDTLEIPLGKNKVLTLTKKQATVYSTIFLILVVVIFGACYGITSMTKQQFISKNEEVESELQNVNEQLKQYENDKGENFDPFKEIEQVLRYNRTKIMSYAALGDSIPKNVYLTYFMTGNEGYIDIQGCADSVEDVYVFFQNLKDYLIDSKLRLSKLDLKAGTLDEVIDGPSSIDKAPYVFEITNMDDSQLSTFMNALRSTAQNNQKQEQGQDQQNQGQTDQTQTQGQAIPVQNNQGNTQAQ